MSPPRSKRPRLGRKVALVDGLPALGGQAVNSIIGTFCGLFANGTHGTSSPTASPTTSCAISARRARCTTAAADHRTPRWSLRRNRASRWIEEAVRKAGITVLLGAVLRDVAREGRRVRELDLATRYGDVKLAATGFVDATGDAVADVAGGTCLPRTGRRSGLRHPDGGARKHRRSATADARRTHRAGAREGRALWPGAHGRICIRLSRPRHGAGEHTHVETPLEPVAASSNALLGKAQADQVLHFLKSEYPDAFGHSRVRGYGLPGIRQTRWIVGRQQLTVDDVRAGTKFSDAIARTAWPIELHDRADKATSGSRSPTTTCTTCRFGSLVPAEADNIVAAGRCIDGDNAALSSVRVMGPCIAMGAAAAHALDLAGSGSVQQIDIAALRQRVRDNVERAD